MVSSALVLMEEIISARYRPSEWNIYGAQASDGDNWHHDSGRCRELLNDKLLPLCRYFAYVQVAEEEQNLWDEYAQLLRSQPPLRDAQGHRAVDDLPGVPRPVQEGRGEGGMNASTLEDPLEQPLPLARARPASRCPRPATGRSSSSSSTTASSAPRPSASAWTPTPTSWRSSPPSR